VFEGVILVVDLQVKNAIWRSGERGERMRHVGRVTGDWETEKITAQNFSNNLQTRGGNRNTRLTVSVSNLHVQRKRGIEE